MAAILAAVTGAGVARRDVRTTLLSVQPRYDYRDGKAPALTGYDLANVVEVTVRDLGALGAVVDGALTAGATSLDGLTFRVDDPRRGRARRPDRGGRRGARPGRGARGGRRPVRSPGSTRSWRAERRRPGRSRRPPG